MRIAELFSFIRERESVRLKKESGAPPPWTQDRILQTYRFCNVHRENDKVTRWIRENWREPNADDPDLFFAMIIARFINLPASLRAVGYPVPFNALKFKRILRARKSAGESVFNNAYMIRAVGCEGRLKTAYLAEEVFSPIWAQRTALRPRKEDTLRSFHERLMTCRDMGSFMTGQVVADVKFHGLLRKAADWWTFAAPGPGSQRGLNAVMGREFKAPWKQPDWLAQLHLLQIKIDPLTREAGMERLSAQDLQNCLCEFSGWYKVKYLGGRKKQLYPGV